MSVSLSLRDWFKAEVYNGWWTSGVETGNQQEVLKTGKTHLSHT